MSLFLDTSAIYALLDRDDQFHEAARTCWFDLLDEPATLLTHNYVLVEAYALVQSRIGMEALRTMGDDLLAPVRLKWVDRELHERAVEAHLTSNTPSISLVDRVSFLFMRKRNLSDVFCFDDDFHQYGFKIHPQSRSP